MSYPKQVPPGWTRGEPVRILNKYGPQFAVGRAVSFDFSNMNADEFFITFDNGDDTNAWLAWWRADDPAD